MEYNKLIAGMHTGDDVEGFYVLKQGMRKYESNKYIYSRIQENMATEFENIFSQRSKKLNVKV